MMADDRLARITARIRAMSIFVLFLVALVGMGQAPIAGQIIGEDCYDYHIALCMSPEEDCEIDEGEPCGEALPGCAGEGEIECVEGALCEEDEIHKFCVFDD